MTRYAECDELCLEMELVLTSVQLSTEEEFCSVGIYARSSRDRAMAQAVSCLPVTVETWVRSQARPHGICHRESGTGTGSFLSALDFPCQFYSANVLYSFVTNVYNFSS